MLPPHLPSSRPRKQSRCKLSRVTTAASASVIPRRTGRLQLTAPLRILDRKADAFRIEMKQSPMIAKSEFR